MNKTPSKSRVATCLAIHDIDKMAIGTDDDRGGVGYDNPYIWVCEKCQIMFNEDDLMPFHKYYRGNKNGKSH